MNPVLIELSIWHVITLLVGFATFIIGFGLILLKQTEHHLAERFENAESARVATQKHIEQILESFAVNNSQTLEELRRLERELNAVKVSLGREYVRREDWVRFAVSIDAKLDALRTRIDQLGVPQHAS